MKDHLTNKQIFNFAFVKKIKNICINRVNKKIRLVVQAQNNP